MGKSSLIIADALAMVTGRDLLGDKVATPIRVWLTNLEDPREEIERRFAAAIVHYEIPPSEVEARLFYDSGRDMPVLIAREEAGGPVFNIPLINNIKRLIQERSIDVLIIDPFVASHAIAENDNTKIAAVVRRWAEIAEETHCAVELVHHTRKPSNGQLEFTADDGRGAGALMAAVRSARVLNPMTKEEAERAGIDKRQLYFRVDSGKHNLAPPSDHAQWRRIVSIDLGNATSDCPADAIGVVTPWSWPDVLAGITAADLLAVQQAVNGKGYRFNVQAKDWVGRAIGTVLSLDPDERAARQRISSALKLWIQSGALIVSDVKDAKGKMRPVIEVGKWAT